VPKTGTNAPNWRWNPSCPVLDERTKKTFTQDAREFYWNNFSADHSRYLIILMCYTGRGILVHIPAGGVAPWQSASLPGIFI